ncbi:3-keto-5-aminohexanoate cleavage protein [Marivita hallyeonensis]|uniref:3-keto-5-aminohexanoate cleavage enzyme n=1 Tax=Marivita hallyeonensis TaxID=996342 RepID=A0A1M5XMU1_9RHOB|nr:3-keto-5-aminohexanoate cleavage protein [Marivita hallyeonensis]SHI01069.1 3-keto-5-aminohexanoate cleavage enzyme [Marivita hallyeonensis]
MPDAYDFNDARDYMKRAGTAKMPPLIICSAMSGGMHGKELNPALPETPEEQAAEAKRCYDAGASMVHIHARDPDTGYARPARRTEDFLEVNRLIRAQCPDLIIDNTSGGGMGLELEERLSSLDANPETSDIDMGPFAIALKLKARKAPLSGRDADEVLNDVLPVTVHETEERARRMKEKGIKAIPALFHPGHWSMVHNLIDKGLIEPPYTFAMMLGMISSSLPTPDAFLSMLRDAPKPYQMFVMSVGRHDLPMSTMAILTGQHVMIGLETNLSHAPGQMADSNARFVERTVRIAKELGREIATPAQAREMLGLSATPTSYT